MGICCSRGPCDRRGSPGKLRKRQLSMHEVQKQSRHHNRLHKSFSMDGEGDSIIPGFGQKKPGLGMFRRAARKITGASWLSRLKMSGRKKKKGMDRAPSQANILVPTEDDEDSDEVVVVLSIDGNKPIAAPPPGAGGAGGGRSGNGTSKEGEDVREVDKSVKAAVLGVLEVQEVNAVDPSVASAVKGILAASNEDG